MTEILTITKAEISVKDESPRELPETTTLTKPLSAQEIGRAIADVVARSDRDYALDLVTMIQVKARIAEDTGERLSLDEFAEQEGFDLAHLRAE